MDSEGQRNNVESSAELRSHVEAAKLLYKAEKERYRQNREERRKEKARRMLELMGEMSLERAQALNGEMAALQAAKAVLFAESANPAPLAGPSHAPAPGLTFRDSELRSRPAGATPGQSQIVSNARGSFPQFEMVGVTSTAGGPPRRSHTLPTRGHSLRGWHHGRRHTAEVEDPATRAVHRINRKLTDMGFSEAAHPDLLDKIRAIVPLDGNLTRDKEDNIITSLLEELVVRTRTPAVASGSRV